MKFEVDTDTLLEKITNKMLENLDTNLRTQELTEEEINATVVLNKKKVIEDAVNISNFITGLYIDPVDEAVEEK